MGGNLNEKHPVTHWFYFQEKLDLLEFETYINEIGFSTLTRDLQRKDKNQELLLIVYHNERINEDSINFDTAEFEKIAKEFHGVYDGWETRIDA